MMNHHYKEDTWRIERNATSENPEIWETVVTKVDDPDVQFKFKTSMVNNLPCLCCCGQSRFDRVDAGVKYRSSDFLIATYPKCGTTWSEQCVLLLTNNADPSQLNPVHKNSYDRETKFGKLWVEAMLLQEDIQFSSQTAEFQNISFEEFADAPEPRVIKTHMPAHLLPGAMEKSVSALPEGMKVIVVARNPLDACVSSYYHAFNPAKNGWPFDAWATTWINGYAMYGDYYHWLKGWYEQYQLHPNRILWVEFEKMKEDSISETRRIARFLGYSEDQEFIERVVKYSSFESMSSMAAEKGGDVIGHLRKGEVGDWKNHFTNDLYELFRQHTEKEFAGLPFQFLG